MRRKKEKTPVWTLSTPAPFTRLLRARLGPLAPMLAELARKPTHDATDTFYVNAATVCKRNTNIANNKLPSVTEA